ncbi:hypothetical protein TNCT_445501 [Trichonephila clavata]|uniref:Uncharacterized protein n=1 Tax=Trichonephila clavata TaxID=2740835 RepID=A0A8X6HAB0_TRICU|nr:hypothetical protein TNCT_445501 [Trichonephila clavata]
MELQIRKSVLKIYKKSINLHYSDMRVASRPRRLKTPGSLFQAVLKEIDRLDIPFRIEPLILLINPLQARRILYNLDLISHVSESQHCTADFLDLGMEITTIPLYF